MVFGLAESMTCLVCIIVGVLIVYALMSLVIGKRKNGQSEGGDASGS
jgi:hypothetical protein